MNSREVIRALEAEGWYRVAQTRSHVQFKHLRKPGRVTVPHPGRDIPRGTLRTIARQVRLKLR